MKEEKKEKGTHCKSSPMVGTANGSNSSARVTSMGTHTRPVFGCTTNGLLSKWLSCLLTFTSRRGYVYWSTTSFNRDRNFRCCDDWLHQLVSLKRQVNEVPINPVVVMFRGFFEQLPLFRASRARVLRPQLTCRADYGFGFDNFQDLTQDP